MKAHRVILTLGLLASACGEQSDGGDNATDARLASDAGIDVIDAQTTDATPRRSRVFVTSAQFAGNLGGLAGADAICQGAANSGNLGGTWLAWLSTESVDAIDHIQDHAPWYLPDRTTLVFASHAQLQGSASAPIGHDEYSAFDPFGIPISDRVVLTGTSRSGIEEWTCNSFTTSSAGVRGTYGFLDEEYFWSYSDSGRCDSGNGRLYCFEQ